MKKLLLSLLLIVCLGASAAFAEEKLAYTIECQTAADNGSGTGLTTATAPSAFFQSGSEYVEKFVTASYITDKGMCGARIGQNTNPGTLKFEFSSKGAVNASKIVVSYGANNANKTVTINGTDYKVTTKNVVQKSEIKCDGTPLSTFEIKSSGSSTNKYFGYLNKIEVYVDDTPALEPCDITVSPLSMYVDEIDELTYTISPAEAAADIKNLTFTSSNPEIYAIERDAADNAKFIYYALEAGTVTLTASWEAGEKYDGGSKEFAVEVKELPTEKVVAEPVFTPTSVYVNTGGTFAVDIDDFYKGVGDIAEPTSDNEDILVVSLDEDGKVAYIAGDNVGTANVTVEWAEGAIYKAGKVTFTVSVAEKGTLSPVFSYPKGLTEGDKGTFTVEPADFFSKVGAVLFFAQDENILTIDEEGVYTAVGAGTTTVTAEWDEGDDYKAGEAEFTVTVEKAPEVTAVAICKTGVTYDGSVKDVKNVKVNDKALTYPNVVTISFSGGSNGDINDTYSESYRIYSALMTFTPAKDVTITKIVFKDVNNGSPTITVQDNNGNISTQNRITTWEGSSTGDVKIKTSAQIRVPYFEIYYTKPDDGKTEVELAWSASTATATIGKAFEAPTLSVTPEDALAAVVLTSSNPAVADFDEKGKIVIFAKGETTITASIAEDNEVYSASADSYVLTVNDPWVMSITSDFLGNKQSAYNEAESTDAKGITYAAVYSCYANNGNIQFNPTNEKGGAASSIVVTENKNGVIIESITINFESAGDVYIKVYADWDNFASPKKSQTPVIRDGLEAVATVKGAVGALSQKVEIGMTAFALIPSASVRISSIDVKYSDDVMPTTMYLHGHFVDRYFDLSNPLEMQKVGSSFVIYQVYFGSEGMEFSDYDPSYVLTTHRLPAQASAKRRVSGPHASDWSDLTEGKVYDADGVKNAADVTSHDQLATFSVPEAGKFYDILADLSDPASPKIEPIESGVQTGVEGVTVQPGTDAVYYDMMGHRVAAPAAGVYIRVQGGRASKVMINK